jgi:tetratricopeptide (TPR) repeat protein
MSEAGDYNQSIREYDKAIEIAPYVAKFYGDRGVSTARIGQTEKALKYFDKAIELDPKNGNSYFNRAIARRKLGDWIGALSDITCGRKLPPF